MMGGRGGGVGVAGPPSHTAYFVALAGILLLLVMLFCYFLYFCLNRIKELTRETSTPAQPATSQPSAATYPIQKGVRDSATAMAIMCKHVPAASGDVVHASGPAVGAGDVVHPAASSPAAMIGDTGLDICKEVREDTGQVINEVRVDKPVVNVEQCESGLVR